MVLLVYVFNPAIFQLYAFCMNWRKHTYCFFLLLFLVYMVLTEKYNISILFLSEVKMSSLLCNIRMKGMQENVMCTSHQQEFGLWLYSKKPMWSAVLLWHVIKYSLIHRLLLSADLLLIDIWKRYKLSLISCDAGQLGYYCIKWT